MKYQINSQKQIEVKVIKEGRTKTKIRILEDYKPLQKGDEIRVLNRKLLYS